MSNTQPLKLDQDGFLVDPTRWNPSWALNTARENGVHQLSSHHWRILYSLRDYYFKYGAVPMLRHVCHINHMERQCVVHLFHVPGKTVCQIAGLPDPGEETKTYL